VPEVVSKRRRGARPPLTPTRITEAALRIADDEGIDAVSIRRIAAEIDARPMSLYDHFASKEDLFDSMADTVTGEVLLSQPLPEGWREALTVIARRSYATFTKHPWLVGLYSRRSRFGPNAVAVSKQAARATSTMPVGETERWLLFGTLIDFVLGHSLRAAMTPRPADLEDVISPEELQRSPELAALPETLRSRASLERFELGLELVLDAIELRCRSARSGR
jgi:AcrR family transcriptional regulator